MAIADTITSMRTHTSNAYTMIGYGTDLTGINKNLENLSSTIFNAFLEALRTPDTLFTNLPKKSGSGANITLNDTANAPMRIMLNATDITQAGTPTPSSPQDIHTISGSNKVIVGNGQLFNKTDIVSGEWIRPDGQITSGVPEYGYSNYIQIMPNENYYVSGMASKSGWTPGFCYYDKNKTYISGEGNSNREEYSFTAPSNAKYFRFTFKLADLDTVLVNAGASAITYVPFITSQEADVDLGGTQLYNYLANALYNSSTTRVQTNDYISLPAGTYTISYSGANQVYVIYFDSNNTKVGETNWQTGALTFTFNTAYKYKFVFRKTGDAVINATEVLNVMLNKGSTALPYQEYIEPINYSKMPNTNYKDQFIRTSGKNIFDKDNANVLNLYINTSGEILTASNGKSIYIECEPSTTYTISRTAGARFRITDTSVLPANGVTGSQFVGTDTASKLVITTSANAKYLVVNYYTGNSDTLSEQAIRDSIMIQKGNIENPQYEPYGSNEWYIKKAVPKIESYNGETITTTYMSTTGGLDTGATVYYGTDTPTYTKITGTLAEQLEYVYQLLKSYKGVTNISQVNNDLPFELDVQAIEDME